MQKETPVLHPGAAEAKPAEPKEQKAQDGTQPGNDVAPSKNSGAHSGHSASTQEQMSNKRNMQELQKAIAGMKDITVSVPAELEQFIDTGFKFGKAIKGAFQDGFQPGSDFPVLLSSAIEDLPVLAKGINMLIPAIRANPFESLILLALAAKKIQNKPVA